VAHIVECLPSKSEALSSNSSTAKEREKQLITYKGSLITLTAFSSETMEARRQCVHIPKVIKGNKNHQPIIVCPTNLSVKSKENL
jgi:hypothetical protein